MKKKILVLGGSGYIGSTLVENLLKKKFKIINYDIQWYGKNLLKNKNLKNIKDDLKNISKYKLKNIDTVVHLANIANDVSSEIDPEFSWKTNVLYLRLILENCKKFGVKKFIYLSSGSVYGVKKEKKVTEKLSLKPISTYNQTKMIAENVLNSYKKNFKIFIIRPATVCGPSKRIRLDISVNQLVYQAVKNKKITIHGGQQIRPNIHIRDLVNAIIFFLEKNVTTGTYNLGFENLKIIDLALKIQKKIKCQIKIEKMFDIRSYRLDSSKIINSGFKKKFSVEHAIDELSKIFITKKFKHEDKNYNILKLKKILAKNKNPNKIWYNKFFKK